jgi:AraC family transcriptional regulator
MSAFREEGARKFCKMLLRSPDFSVGNVEFMRSFQAKWGRENCIIWTRTRHADFGPRIHTLSIRAAWGGTELCEVQGRTVGVDDDNFLILNHGRICTTSIRSTRPVESLAISFRPELVERTYDAMAASIEVALLQGDTFAERTPEFMEHLHPHDQTISPILRFIKAHLLQGLDDEAWYEEQLIFLLERMQAHHNRLLGCVDALRLVRAATRREVFRRIHLATDYLHTNYAQRWDLESLAKVAYLSKYHFLRLFTLVHGVTPSAYLQRKRTQAALRLLQTTGLSVDEVASHVGFRTRTDLRRQTRRWIGATPSQVRAQGVDGRPKNPQRSVPDHG